ncbi:unnamed protein product [Peronospora farinosa]|uniref:tRNA-uridine aminocarboxypropyltransferase n=1 Tax=Peronospora farinosa TaxID=134698 RepID=A0AAV0TN96_9STRA|nr:unnamed protein product [Peronospora farinosa]CAI5724708.1 unnamed protein product [Peronospora farinosa]
MGQPSKSPPTHDANLSSSLLHWDGKCQNCRKLMSRCMCFRESDTDPLDTRDSSEMIADASQTRPLWNALRKMHRTSTVTHQSLMQLPKSLQPSSHMLNDNHCKRSKALPSRKATTSVTSTSKSRHHVDKRSDTRPSQRSRYDRRKPRDGSLLDHSLCYKDGLQRADVTSSSYILKRDVKDGGVMRSVQSIYSIDKHNLISTNRPKENFRCGLEEGLRPSDENDGTVWEL